MARVKQTELDLLFDLPVAANSTNFIDIGQCYSLVNRIFTRQGLQYAVAQIQAVGASDSEITIGRLPESWPCINAWEKSYHIWRKSQDQVLDDQPGIQGRYHDFKIFMNAAHHSAGFAGNLLPVGFVITHGSPHAYDWSDSDIQIPNLGGAAPPTAFNLHMIGSSVASSKGMIEGYAFSRSRPQDVDPNAPEAVAGSGLNWMEDAFDVASNLEEIRDDLLEENNEPPYLIGTPGTDDEFYPGGGNQGGVVKEATLITRNGIGTNTYASGFTAPCGLLRVVVDSGDDPTAVQLRVTLMAGTHKGCMARPMQDVN